MSLILVRGQLSGGNLFGGYCPDTLSLFYPITRCRVKSFQWLAQQRAQGLEDNQEESSVIVPRIHVEPELNQPDTY